VVNPDDIVEKYGADTLRMYEMFLGPLEQSKPWDTSGIDGVHKFLRKTWRLFFDRDGKWSVTDEKATAAELKSLHKIIKKVEDDVDHFSFNTSVSAFMICVNELTDLKCHKREILEPLIITLSPFAPHLAEELWHKLGHETSIVRAAYPPFKAEYLVENEVNYPVSFNGKTRYTLSLPATLNATEVEAAVLANEQTATYLAGKPIKKVIVVPKKIVNIVC
jgi:leucyl-tRNA synthetase